MGRLPPPAPQCSPAPGLSPVVPAGRAAPPTQNLVCFLLVFKEACLSLMVAFVVPVPAFRLPYSVPLKVKQRQSYWSASSRLGFLPGPVLATVDLGTRCSEARHCTQGTLVG